jgi:hypothetical protein
MNRVSLSSYQFTGNRRLAEAIFRHSGGDLRGGKLTQPSKTTILAAAVRETRAVSSAGFSWIFL